ncbi:hypothetical protein AB205_0088370 [Aquarana catesbeiana]|uniref:Uncharacterized protein n=1 Tax=Aquarana catesbeiana TaxID=8400 RepID=A0A2G9RJ01_AQUCT|nr:hypothetical protein AB205_0088370 [Aquarana catesbeiana]
MPTSLGLCRLTFSFLLCSIWHPSRISDLIIISIISISSIFIITTGDNLAIHCGLGNMNANLSTSSYSCHPQPQNQHLNPVMAGHHQGASC